jgi:multicomponent Na+:H+ antiporter subunit D
MLFGSISAIWENDVRRMIAFSSVAQIGYIFMGFGLSSMSGMVASVFHIFAHSASKALLFISVIGMTDTEHESRKVSDLRGAGYRNIFAGIGFTVGSFSMVGIPLFAGFISKIMFAEAAVSAPSWRMFPTLIALAISTILNAIYFMKTVMRIYTPMSKEMEEERGCIHIVGKNQKWYVATILVFIVLNLFLGMNSEPILQLIQEGLHNFM